jgi:hypothetical protein
MFPTVHPDGHVDVTATPPVVCELALPGPRISPHLFGWTVEAAVVTLALGLDAAATRTVP